MLATVPVAPARLCPPQHHLLGAGTGWEGGAVLCPRGCPLTAGQRDTHLPDGETGRCSGTGGGHSHTCDLGGWGSLTPFPSRQGIGPEQFWGFLQVGELEYGREQLLSFPSPSCFHLEHGVAGFVA